MKPNPAYPEEIRGTDVSYARICQRRLWISLHSDVITDGTEHVYEGKFLSERKRKAGFSEVTLGRNRLDSVSISENETCVHEFKKGRHLLECDRIQVAHYINLLQRAGFHNVYGVVHLLGSRDVAKIFLDPETWVTLHETYRLIEEMKLKKIPTPVRNSFCFSGCSLVEFCWGDI